jgi:hypothetical protein
MLHQLSVTGSDRDQQQENDLLHQTPCHLAHPLPPCRGAQHACAIAGACHTHRFEVCMVVTMMINVVWDVTLHSSGYEY